MKENKEITVFLSVRYKDRLYSLMETGKSGKIALLSDGTAVVWLQPLSTIFATGEWGYSYRECDSIASAERFVDYYAGQSDELPLSESEYSEQEFVSDCLWRLLWAMAHDPDIDVENELDNYWEWDVDQDSFERESLTGAETLERDIATFFNLLAKGEGFQIGNKQFTVSASDGDKIRPVFSLYEASPEPFLDEETCLTYQVLRLKLVFRASSAAILYAKCRAFRASGAFTSK